MYSSYAIPTETVTWTGGCKDGLAEGFGTLRWFKRGIASAVYEGEVMRGRLHGKGVFVPVTGGVYEGAFVDGKRQGNGKQTLFGGAYNGPWDDNEPHGKGIVTYPNGEQHEREFEHGIPVEQAQLADHLDNRYSLKGETATGSRVLRTIANGLQVPFDKSYADLTPSQKLRVKQPYLFLGPDDEPPYPEGGLAAITNAIAKRSSASSGDLLLEALIDAQGKFVSVTVLLSPDPRTTQLAAEQLMNAKFKPAVCAGKPCAMIFPLRVSFNR